MDIKIQTILNYLSKKNIEFNYQGDKALSIQGFCSISNPKKQCVTWIKKICNCDTIMPDKELNLLIVANLCLDDTIESHAELNIIDCNNPKEVFFEILSRFFEEKTHAEIMPTSVVLTSKIGFNVSIGHHCYINENVTIGNNVIIGNNVSIESPAVVGDNSHIDSGVIIGSIGFGYFQNANKEHVRVPHFGGVVIGDRVDIGANTVISRGTIDDTVIMSGTKIDANCHISHNDIIGENTLITGGVVIGGSCKVGNNSYIALGTIIKNQLTIGDESFIGMGSVVIKDVKQNTSVFGCPAKILPLSSIRP